MSPRPAQQQELATEYDRLLRTVGVLSRIFLSRAITTFPAALLNHALLVARDILADDAESVSQSVGDGATTLRPTEEERKGAGGLKSEVPKGMEVVWSSWAGRRTLSAKERPMSLHKTLRTRLLNGSGCWWNVSTFHYHCRDARWLAWLAVHHRLTKLIHQNVKQDNRYCSGRMKRWVHT